MIAFTASPTLSFISSALRFVITLSIRSLPTRTTTCAITPPNWISSILPTSLLRAESVMRLLLCSQIWTKCLEVEFECELHDSRIPRRCDRAEPGAPYDDARCVQGRSICEVKHLGPEV